MLKHTPSFLCQMLLLCLVSLSSQAAFAAGTVSVVSADGRVFKVMASGLNGPGGYQLTLNYDSSRLRDPKVTLGPAVTGALNASNTNIPGVIILALAKTTAMPGTGEVATITFTTLGDSLSDMTIGGLVIGTNTNGGTSANDLHPNFLPWYSSSLGSQTTTGSQSSSTGGQDLGGNASGGSNTTTTTTSTGAPNPYVVGGTVTLPSDVVGMQDRKDVPTQPNPDQPPAQPQPGQQEPRETSAPAAGPDVAALDAQAQAKKVPGYTPRQVSSVLESFRLFTGDKTPSALTALFAKEPGIPFTQSPSIGIADGKATVRVVVTGVFTERAPSFSFSHATFISVKETGDGEWQIEARPEKGAIRASITMLADGVLQDIPLTVAPKVTVDLDKSGSVTEADFLRFLKTRGTEAAPKFDLNGDGKRNYQDDYIFTANYLAAGGKVGKETPGRKNLTKGSGGKENGAKESVGKDAAPGGSKQSQPEPAAPKKQQ